MSNFIISQILGGVALILVCISYFLNKKYFLICQIFANVFYGAGFIVSASLVAGINTFISIIRVLIFYFYERKEKDIPWYYLIIFSPIYITIGIVFYKNPWDILTMCTPIMFTFAMMIKKMIVVNYCMLLPNLLFFLYCMFNRFYTAAALDFIEICVITVSIILYYVKKHKGKGMYLQKNDYEKDIKIQDNKIDENIVK